MLCPKGVSSAELKAHKFLGTENTEVVFVLAHGKADFLHFTSLSQTIPWRKDENRTEWVTVKLQLKAAALQLAYNFENILVIHFLV